MNYFRFCFFVLLFDQTTIEKSTKSAKDGNIPDIPSTYKDKRRKKGAPGSLIDLMEDISINYFYLIQYLNISKNVPSLVTSMRMVNEIKSTEK